MVKMKLDFGRTKGTFVKRHFFQTKHFLNVFEKPRNTASIQSGTLATGVRRGLPVDNVARRIGS
jgi:hypothetical protein